MQTLYDYQEEPYAQVMRALDEEGCALLFMATGLGKTAVSGHVARTFLQRGKRGLFLYCENEGLGQSERRFREIIGNDISYKKFYGTTTKDWDADQGQMLFASFQSMNSIGGKWYTIFSPDHFGFIIVDEAHHAKADTYEEVINHFTGKKLGMTGTPDREDGRDIREIFGKEVTHRPLAQGIARGWLKKVEYHTISDGINTRKLKHILREVISGEKRITVKQLNETIFIQKRNRIQKDIIKSYNTIKEHSVKKRTLIFCENINHAKNFFSQFKNGEAGLIHSKQNYKINNNNLKKFRKGDIQYLLCIDKFNECIHVAGIEVIVFLRATDSRRIFLQQLGRGLAKSDIAEKVTVLDFVQNAHRLVLIRELAKQIREEAEKFDSNKVFDKNIFDVKGNYYDLTHVDTTIIDVLNILDAIERGFYNSYEEAKSASIKLGFNSGDEYKVSYKVDLRLPSNPNIYYKDEGWNGWDSFLEKEKAPEGWMSAADIRRCSTTKVSKDETIKFFAEQYRNNHPEWFGIFWSSFCLTEYFHPDLVEILLGKFNKSNRKPVPKDWHSANLLSKFECISTTSAFSIKDFAEQYREKHPEWFDNFFSGSLVTECYHPDLVKIIKKNFDPKDRIAPEGWMTASSISSSPSIVYAIDKIKEFAETYRKKNPEWFKDYFSGSMLNKHYHPLLVAQIKKEFTLNNRYAPKNWKTLYMITKNAKIRSSQSSIRRFAETYRDLHPEWFKFHLSRSGGQSEHYHPNLVKLIINEFTSNHFQSAPEGWFTGSRLVKMSEVISSQTTMKSFVNNYRKDHPEWFQIYRSGNYPSMEHFHPDLIKLIKKEFNRKSEYAPSGWRSANSLSGKENSDFKVTASSIGNFVEPYRSLYPEWFKDYASHTNRVCEHYHPDLLRLINSEFSIALNKAPEGWLTKYSVENINTVQCSIPTIMKFVKKYRESNSEWFHFYFSEKNTKLEHYHPDLVELIKNEYKK